MVCRRRRRRMILKSDNYLLLCVLFFCCCMSEIGQQQMKSHETNANRSEIETINAMLITQHAQQMKREKEGKKQKIERKKNDNKIINSIRNRFFFVCVFWDFYFSFFFSTTRLSFVNHANSTYTSLLHFVTV